MTTNVNHLNINYSVLGMGKHTVKQHLLSLQTFCLNRGEGRPAVTGDTWNCRVKHDVITEKVQLEWIVFHLLSLSLPPLQ